ncbi:hypothetical protein FQR65_LT19753 [Abscondita terminalis]|nr:hypothetical protein FQR65_LT19753 [Abscondita terminalis]
MSILFAEAGRFLTKLPTVKSSNAGRTGSIDQALALADKLNADIVAGTDPDSDRLGVAVRDNAGKMVFFERNQTMAISFRYCKQLKKNYPCTGRTRRVPFLRSEETLTWRIKSRERPKNAENTLITSFRNQLPVFSTCPTIIGNRQNLHLLYEEENVLKTFSLEVQKGQTVALVGQSGSGKSTIANLLTRFYDVQEGEIKIDDTNIKDLKLDSLRGLLAW